MPRWADPHPKRQCHAIMQDSDYPDRWWVYDADTGEMVADTQDKAQASLYAASPALYRALTSLVERARKQWSDNKWATDVFNQRYGGILRLLDHIDKVAEPDKDDMRTCSMCSGMNADCDRCGGMGVDPGT